MFEVFGAIAAALAVAAPVARNLKEIAEGGRNLFRFAGDVWARLRRDVPPAKQAIIVQAALEQAAAMPRAEFDKKAEEIAEKALPDSPPEDRKAAAEYLKLIPARIRTTFARPEDPSGKTAPAQWAVARPEDLLPLLPPRPPRFTAGDVPPNAPGWELVERLGIGGFGEVWKARKKGRADLFRAFKFCLDPASRKSILENETDNIVLVQDHLGDHPNVVRLLDYHIDDDDAPWLAYDYVAGGDLGGLVALWGADIEVRARLAVDHLKVLAATLAHCHAGFDTDTGRKRVVHRDMKPANVLVGRNGTLKITDFGISDTQARQALDEAKLATVANMTVSTPSLVRWANTPMYASPQQKQGAKPRPADDVHALGVMLYQMVLGDVNRPLYHDYREVLERRHVCAPLVQVVVRATASDAADRYQDGGELLRALEALPQKPISEPVIVSQEDLDSELYRRFDQKASEARVKNEEAKGQLGRREWCTAVATLESIFHPVLRDKDLYERAVAHRDGKRFVNAIGMEFALVPAGTFWMGGGDGKCGDKQVTIERDFYIGVYPVMQEEWCKVEFHNPSFFQKGGKGAGKLAGVSDADIARLPAESVSWPVCQAFIRKLNEQANKEGWRYRLPTEAEWEYACRGAATSQRECAWSFYLDRPTNDLSPQWANFSNSHIGRTCKVGSYPPNALGLHDMHGNVWEWCQDWFDQSHPVSRGGGWDNGAKSCSAGHRNRFNPTDCYSSLGLRLARVPAQ